MRVLHVVPNCHAGGAGRALEETARMVVGAGASASVLSLGSSSGQVRQRLSSSGIAWSDGSDLARADVVLVHFSNTPAMHRFLRSSHPPMRAVVWSMVEGGTRPQVITKEVAAFSDILVTTSRSTLSLPELKSKFAACVPTWIDQDYFVPRRTVALEPFTVGYYGTVDFVKMHPDYISLSAAVPDADIRFGIWGWGNAYPILKRQAARIGQEHRFQFHGTVTDAADALSNMHVYGYPLCEDTYAANDRTMQEGMSMGLPSVVLDRPGLRDLAINGVTALVTKSAHDYAGAIAKLRTDAELRKRLGQGAREHVRLRFEPTASKQRLYQILTEALSRPKRLRKTMDGGAPVIGARLFVASLGRLAGEYSRSLSSFEGGRSRSEEELNDDEQAIAAATPGLCNPGGGGILDYRAAYPYDPVLRYWSGLIFSQQRHYAVALAEFLEALKLGLPKRRLEFHLAAVGRQCGLSNRTIEDYSSQAAGRVPQW